MRNWLLPEYIEDVLPAEAARMEQMRRALLDLFHLHGYQLVIPPMLEYVESLMAGAGEDLDLATFKVVDLLSGRLMGVRADITPQTARMDAHLLNRQGVTRLCYAGSVLRAKPDGLARTREPLQVGAELYGHAGVESDIEIQRLLVQGLRAVGIKNVQLDFSHVGIFRSLVQRSSMSETQEQNLLAALQSKDKSAVAELVAGLDAQVRDALLALADLYGDIAMLDRAEKILPAHDEIRQALRELRTATDKLQGEGVHVSFDLAELRGYHYHSGMVFAAYAEGYAKPLALGGRYDEIGSIFGRARPATGFSLDLRGLATALPPARNGKAILAPYAEDAALNAKIAELRASGEVVIVDLPGHEAHRAELGCDRALVKQGGSWVVTAN
ncbi:MAG: ATP phosphoribosyltransferase regulatory subunit [Methylobacillus sp.]|jgi:ATP phosphoribosyltransferase regulatory subunit|nr:ATP phosphoribosyltransferase regulatory subunit [Methylobacillus sp.]